MEQAYYINGLEYLKKCINDYSLFDTEKCKDFYNEFRSSIKDLSNIDIDELDYKYLDVIKTYKHSQLLILLKRNVTVTVTSYPKRIKFVSTALNSILNQTKKADRIILYLAKEEFPNKEKDLPQDLIDLYDNKQIEISWCNNIYSHKKYMYSMKQFPDDIIITIDDDLIYDLDMIEKLFLSYLIYPNAISSMRTHIMLLKNDEELYKYNEWIQQSDYLMYQPSIHLFATSGAGTLFPPNIINKELLNETLAMSLCPTADDVYLKMIEIIDNIPTVLVKEYSPLKKIKGSQEDTLYNTNESGGNDQQITNMINWSIEKYKHNIIIENLLNPVDGVNLNTKQSLKDMLVYETKKSSDTILHNFNILKDERNKNKKLQKQINKYKNSLTYRLHNKLISIKNIFRSK